MKNSLPTYVGAMFKGNQFPNKMKKLLQINTVSNSGSTGRIAEEIGLCAMHQGWESYIAYGRGDRPSASYKFRIGSDLMMYTNAIRARLFDSEGFTAEYATNKLVEFIQRIKPDIIHLHNIHGYYLNVEILFKYVAAVNIPVVWTLHDCWSLTGHCTHFDYVNCSKWKTLCFQCPQKSSYPASFFADRSEKNYLKKKELFTSVEQMTIVTVSQWLNNIVNKSFLKNYPIKVINSGIDTNLFKPIFNGEMRKNYKLDGKFVILGVASIWSQRKGLSDFIALSRIIDTNSIIILVGLNPKQTKDLPSNIIGISRTENIRELAELYSTANVYVNTSVEETFGLTNVEALSCGTPIIVYNATACPESVSTETGLIVAKNNVPALWEAIQEVKLKGKGHYSAHCVERAHALYRKEDRNNEYIYLYNNLLKNRIAKQ